MLVFWGTLLFRGKFKFRDKFVFLDVLVVSCVFVFWGIFVFWVNFAFFWDLSINVCYLSPGAKYRDIGGRGWYKNRKSRRSAPRSM